MADYIKAQIEERAKAYEAAKEILDRAAAENRSLDSTERESVDRAFARMDEMKARIDDFRSLEAREQEIADATAAHEEARTVSAPALETVTDAELIRALARGEHRSLTFEKRDVTTGSTGSPVPTSFYDQVMMLARAVGPMLDVATVLNTAGGEDLQIPSLSAYSTGTITSEANAIGESDPTFNSFITLGAYKYSFLTQVSTELLEDAGVDIQPSLAESTPDRVLGYPLIENPAMASVGTGAKSVIAGHLPSYMVRQVGGIRLDRSDDYAFADGLVTFRATFRVDGDLPQSSHIKYFIGGAS
jgi:HK97 family phage major capsid protein